jgi:uncharacterized protein DUF4304
MTEPRARMMTALRSRLVAPLRERGFVGSFPHFRRPLADRIDYLNVQFQRAGGGFTLNLGRTGPEGFTAGPWRGLPIEEIEVGHIFDDRRRITPRDAAGGWRGGEFWAFGPRSTDDPRPPEPQQFYDAIADEALATFVRIGEPWFARRDPPETGAETRPPPEGRQPGDPTFLSRLRWRLRLRRPRLRVGVVVGGLEPPLWRWEHWRRIVPVMDELVALLPRPVSILSQQGHESDMKALPFGRMPWSEAGNRKWTTKYLDGPEPVCFTRTEFWSPSRTTWVEEGKDPEMYARLDRDPHGEVQGFILALRRDRLATLGLAEAADRTLAAVAAALPGSRRVINDRGWAESKFLMVQSNPLDWPGSGLVHEWGSKRPWSQVAAFGA